MWNNLLFSFECVTPYFLLIVAGYFLSRKKLVTQGFLQNANKFTFQVALPISLFLGTISIDWTGDVNFSFLGFILCATLICFMGVWALSELLFQRKYLIGTLVQGAVRSNYILLGVPIVGAVMGTDSALAQATLVSAALIPLYNVLSVIVLLARGSSDEKATISVILRGIARNPLIWGAVSGILCSLLLALLPTSFCFPPLVESIASVSKKGLSYISGTATPLGLLSIGGMLNWKDATARLKDSLYAVFVKNLLLVMIMLPLSYLLGFRQEELVIVLVAFGAPSAISSYAMASQMGGDPPLAANILIITTFLSAFVMAGGIYTLRVLEWIS